MPQIIIAKQINRYYNNCLVKQFRIKKIYWLARNIIDLY